jgi:predicted Zn finger-like uncharacterized protein
MAVEAICPICGAVFSLRDDMQGKKVRCTKCEHAFTVGGEAKAKEREEKQGVQTKAGTGPKKSSREDDDDERSTSRKAKAARRGRDDDDDDDDAPRGRAKSRRGRDDDDDDDDGKKKAKRAYHDDDDDEEENRSKKLKDQVKPKRAGGGGSSMTPILIAGGALLALLLICGGVGWVIYAIIHKTEEVVADVQDNVNKGFQQGGNPGGGWPGQPNPNKFASVDDAVAGLKSAQAGERVEAARWLVQAKVDAGKQKEVGRALEPLLTDPNNDVRYTGMQALAAWATQDSVPDLARALDNEKADGFQNDGLKAAMMALGRLKDARGGDAVARFLPNFFCREDAARALQQMGPAAEKAVLKYYNHKDGGVREKARVLVQGYRTKDAAIIAQCVEDVTQSTERDTRRDAARWLKTARVDPQQQKAVSAALGAAVNDTDNEVAEAALDALDTWATAENVPALIKLVEDPTNGGRQDNMRRKAMATLGRLKAATAAAAIAARLPNGGDRAAAASALIAIGPPARDAVMTYATHQDQGVRNEAARILRSLGADTSGLRMVQALADLKSNEGNRRNEAAKALAATKVDPKQQPEVAKALEEAADNTNDLFAQVEVIKALGVWGTKDSGAVLVKIFETPNVHPLVKNAAVDALIKLKDERAVKPLAAKLLNPGERGNASKALIAFGPEHGSAIENEVAAGLFAIPNDTGLKKECAKILGAVGTKASVAQLEKAAKTALASKPQQKDVAQACEDAIAAINARPN